MAGTYTLTVSDGNNCTGLGSTTIVINANPVATANNNGPLCVGDQLILMGGPNGLSYSWSGPSTYSSASQSPIAGIVTTAMAGSYSLVVTDVNNCSSSLTTNVTVNALPIANAGKDSTVIKGKSIKLNGSGGIHFLWESNDYLDCDNCHDPISTPDKAISYVLSVTDSNGCMSTDTINITVDFFSNIYIPSAFSPNGDGINDVFYVRGLNISDIQLMIFDRWGNLVFETTDQSIGWNGYYRGTLFVPEVFMYVLTGKDPEGKKINFKGNITLVL
jgi:gliding motility-associated-like protein